MSTPQGNFAMKAWTRLVICIALGAVGSTGARGTEIALPRAPEISGTYDDDGTVALAPPEGVKVFASLHAFLSGEFSAGMARLIHEKTGVVRLKHVAGHLEAEVTDHEGETAWNMEWKQGDTFGVKGARVIILFKGTHLNDDQYRLVLESVSAYKLLQVDVQRLIPSTFGLQVKPLGVYLFSRAE
jgi:hypothetical protein